MTAVVEEAASSFAAPVKTTDKGSNENTKSKNENGQVNHVLHNNIPTLSPCSPPTPASMHNTVRKHFPFSDDQTVSMNGDYCFEEMKRKEEKVDEILDCLNGVTNFRTSETLSKNDLDYNDDEKVVDLWHLRQLAISEHGLVNANMRKRAWPKLVGANEHILNSSIASLPVHFSRENRNCQEEKSNKLNDIPEADIIMIKKDITACVWNIEEEIKTVRKMREVEKERKRNTGMQIVFKKEKIGREDASVASVDSGLSSITAGRITPQLIPEAIRAFPRFGPPTGIDAAQSPSASGTSTPVSGVATPNTLPSITPIGIQNISINENSDVPSTIKKSKARYLRKRKEEQALLLNIITSVLRAVPDEEESSDIDSDLGVDDDTVVADNIRKLYYFKDMHNLIGPILITLESPSLTSLVVNRLAQSHLRDAMGSTFDNIQAGIRLIFMPLLESVDKTLHDYLIKGDLKDPCVFALQWVMCWFATDVSNYDIIGRLFDVFISSHASFPVYFSVAMITHTANKGRIMMTPCEKSALKAVIFSLPSTTSENINAKDMIEDMIRASLSYMKSVTIQTLINKCKRKIDSNTYIDALKSANSVSLLRKPPTWAYASSTSTDWTLIKQAKALRGLSPTTRSKKKKVLLDKNRYNNNNRTKVFLYETALDASGLSSKMKDSIRNNKKRHSIATKIILFIMMVAIGLALVSQKPTDTESHSRKRRHVWEKVASRMQNIEKFIQSNESRRKDLDHSRKVKQRKKTGDKKPVGNKQQHVKKWATVFDKKLERVKKVTTVVVDKNLEEKKKGTTVVVDKNLEEIKKTTTVVVDKNLEEIKKTTTVVGDEKSEEVKKTTTVVGKNINKKYPDIKGQENIVPPQTATLIGNKVEGGKKTLTKPSVEPIMDGNEQLKPPNSFGRAISRIKQYLEDDTELLAITF